MQNIILLLLLGQCKIKISIINFTFSDLAVSFIQSDFKMRTIEAIKINKRAMVKCYDKSQLA